MEAISIGSDPHLYFQVGKIKISEGMKCLQDLVQGYKDNLIPGNAGILDATMTYLQSLQQEIESLAQEGKVLVSSNVNGTDLQCGQEITQIREQNAFFGPTLNQENEMVMNPNVEDTSSSKRRKLRSEVWQHFTKDKGKDGKEWATCKHCEKDLVGSSKSGTTHLKNHLKSCRSLRNPGGVVDKEKDKSLIDPALNGSDMVLESIKYRLNSIKNDILDVYKQEKDRFNRYLHKVPSRFNVTIEKEEMSGLSFITCWFIDDSWKLQNITSVLGRYEDEDEDEDEIVMSWLVDQNIDKKICSMTRVDFSGQSEREQFSENINHLFNERCPLPFIGNFWSIDSLLRKFYCLLSHEEMEKVWRNDISTKARNLWRYVSSNVDKFHCAVQKAVSMGKKVTSQIVPPYFYSNWGWIMGGKEAFCELEHIDPDFKSINFTKEEWDEATLLYSNWKQLEDLEKEILHLMDLEYKTANVYFPTICDVFLKIVQLGKSGNHYHCHVAARFREILEMHWDDFNLILVIATILDPRFKMDVVKKFYEEFYDDPVHLEIIIVEVTNIYTKYAEGTNILRSSSSLVHGASNSSSAPSQMLDIVGTSLAFSQHVNDTAVPESELDRYLRDSKCLIDEEFDILEWWRINSSTYPILTKITRDFLSIPINTGCYLINEISDILSDDSNLDDDLKVPLACARIWLNNL